MLEMAHLRAVLRYISYAKFLQFLEVPWDFHRLTLDPEIVQLPAFFILSAMFTGTMWPTREDKPCFATTLKHSAHDHETCLYKHQGTSSGMTLGTAWLESLDLASASNTSPCITSGNNSWDVYKPFITSHQRHYYKIKAMLHPLICGWLTEASSDGGQQSKRPERPLPKNGPMYLNSVRKWMRVDFTIFCQFF